MAHKSARRMYLHRYYHLQRMGYTDDDALVGAIVFVFAVRLGDGLSALTVVLQQAGLAASEATNAFAKLAALLRKD